IAAYLCDKIRIAYYLSSQDKEPVLLADNSFIRHDAECKRRNVDFESKKV
ncbi:13681_t:CDS:1, partial [Gigaspora margarita]